MTSDEIKAILRRQITNTGIYVNNKVVVFDEFIPGTGYDGSATRRIDMWSMNLWPSHDFKQVAMEIKISRGDFLREIKSPQKRQWAMTFSNEFYFVAPKGLILPGEIPEQCGLLEVEDGHFRKTVKAAFREIGPPSWAFVAAVCRRVYREEVKMIGVQQ